MTTAGNSRDIEHELLAVLEKYPADIQEIQRKLLEIEERSGIDVYCQFLYLLCHLHFSPKEAKRHWQSILAHQAFLKKCKRKPIDFRVALLDYFLSVNRRMHSPKVIEIKIFQKTQESAIRDELTGLYNYRCFRDELKREVERTRRNGESVSLCFFDLDHFKMYNDQNGHMAGDQALQAVGRIIQEEIRKCDLAVRYGGEEFAVILPGATKAQACMVAERIRKRIAEHDFPFGQHQPGGRLTISGGVATYRADAKEPDAFLEMADRALYRAKGLGKNCISTASSEFREYPRFEVKIPVTVRCMATQHETFVTQDLSEKGFRFTCSCPIEKGDFFGFVLRPSPKEMEISGIAQAVRSRRSGGSFMVAARIAEMPPEGAKRLKEILARRIRGRSKKMLSVSGVRG